MPVDMNLLWGALGAAASAFVYALAVYYSKTKEEDWRGWKAAQTCILAAGVALVGVYFGWGADVITASPMYAFVGVLIERGLKWLQRAYLPALPLVA